VNVPFRRFAPGRQDSCMVRIGGYDGAPDATAATWIAEGLRGFAESVLSLVPAGFEAYGRIFHPAWRSTPRTRVSWRQVAQANGRVANRAMQWGSITGSERYVDSAHQPGVWDDPPALGTLPKELTPVLALLLARHTATPRRCWFAVWEGYGCLASDARDTPFFDIPGRRLRLFTGPISAIRESLCPPPFWQSPSLWWPDDRAWCVETEVDLMSTYVGGTRQCIEDLVAQRDLEALIADPADGVTWQSDNLNPLPEWD
jgi:hypothetical protein